jgi:hypothetical protein
LLESKIKNIFSLRALLSSFNSFSENKKEILVFFATTIFFIATAFLFNLPLWVGVVALIFFFGFYLFKAFSFIVTFDKKKSSDGGLSVNGLSVNGLSVNGLNIVEGLNLFFISDFVELITFSGKIGSDAAKAFFLNEKFSLKEIAIAVGIFRVATIISLVAMVIAVINPFSIFLTLSVLVILFFVFRKLALSSFCNIVSDFFRIGLFAVIIFAFNIPITQELILFFLGANTISRIIFILPHGLLLQDSLLGLALQSVASLPEIVLINTILRTFTFVPAAGIGGLLVSKKVLEKIKNEIEKRKLETNNKTNNKIETSTKLSIGTKLKNNLKRDANIKNKIPKKLKKQKKSKNNF